MGNLNKLVLVINASYEPVVICSAKRAMTLLVKGAAVNEAASGYFIRTPRMDYPLPSVIRLTRYRKVPRLKRTPTRKNIMLRDGYQCGYCDKKFAPINLTLDHVVPRSRGGGHDWENVVAACKPCNNAKGDRTPEEAGMPLLRRPMPLGIHGKFKLISDGNKAWDRYLFV